MIELKVSIHYTRILTQPRTFTRKQGEFDMLTKNEDSFFDIFFPIFAGFCIFLMCYISTVSYVLDNKEAIKSNLLSTKKIAIEKICEKLCDCK